MDPAVKAITDTPPKCVIEKQFLVSFHQISNSGGENNVNCECASIMTQYFI
jgi:hypothetical protein